MQREILSDDEAVDSEVYRLTVPDGLAILGYLFAFSAGYVLISGFYVVKLL